MVLASAWLGTGRVSTMTLANGTLIDADGTVVGEIISLEIDVKEGQGGTYGGGLGSSDNGEASVLETTTQPEGSAEGNRQEAMLPDPVDEIWAHYQNVIPNGERRKLDARRKTVIRRALKVRTVDDCKRAITGLSQSAFHQGQNDRQTAYNDVEYALGKKTDSPDAVIDRWLERTPTVANGRTTLRQLLGHITDAAAKQLVYEDVARVRRWYENPGHEPSIEAGQRSQTRLRGRPATIEPVVEDGQLTGWQRVTNDER